MDVAKNTSSRNLLHIATPEFNGIVDISEEKNAPLIVGIHPDEVEHVGVEMITAVRQRAHRSSVPIAIHWDHGANYKQILIAIQSGFTSVMIDGSMLPFEENVAISRRVTDRPTPSALGRAIWAHRPTDNEAEDGSNVSSTPSRDSLSFVEGTAGTALLQPSTSMASTHGYEPELSLTCSGIKTR